MSDESAVEVNHDPGFITVFKVSIGNIWNEGPWYRLMLLLMAAVMGALFTALIVSALNEVLGLAG